MKRSSSAAATSWPSIKSAAAASWLPIFTPPEMPRIFMNSALSRSLSREGGSCCAGQFDPNVRTNGRDRAASGKSAGLALLEPFQFGLDLCHTPFELGQFLRIVVLLAGAG